MIAATIVSAAYVAFQMMADIASLRIVMIAGFSIDAGTFVYPFTFTLRDMVHKTAGIKAARALIVTAAVLNLIMAGVFLRQYIFSPHNVGWTPRLCAVWFSPLLGVWFFHLTLEVLSPKDNLAG